VFSELSLLKVLGSYLVSVVHFKWQLFTTHLGSSHPSKWHDPYVPFHKLSLIFLFLSSITPSIIPFPFAYLFFIFLFYHNLASSILCYFNFRTSSLSSPYIVFFPLSSRSEYSHLLNHLDKFMFSGNLLWVSHHILPKTKTHKQSATIKYEI